MQVFLSFFKLTRIRHKIFLLTEANISCNNLSTVASYKHTSFELSSTRLQSIDGRRKLGEPDRSSLDTPGLTVPEGPGAGATSPGAAFPDTPMLAPCITKSHSKPSVPLLGWGLAPSTSTLAPPSDVPSAPDIACSVASHGSDTKVSPSATTSHGEPGGHGSVTRTRSRQTIGAEEYDSYHPSTTF
jgi:hypothetical protein